MVVVENSDIRGGKPVIKDTRVAVKDITDRFYGLGRSSSDIASDLGIDRSDVEEALRYYHDNMLEDKDPVVEA